MYLYFQITLHPMLIFCLFPADSSSQSLSAGPPMMSLPVGFDHLPEAQREMEEEERRQREEEEREEQELHQQQAQELSEWMNRPSVPQQPTPQVHVCAWSYVHHIAHYGCASMW